MKIRIILSLILIFFYSVIAHMGNDTSLIAIGNVAGMQMDSSNVEYVAFSGIVSLIHNLQVIIESGAFILLLVIWVPYAYKYFKSA